MQHRLPALLSLLVVATLAPVAPASEEPGLKTSWKEKDARVEIFSPDGRTLVSSGGDGYQLRDAKTGAVRTILSERPHGHFRKLAISPDSRLFFAQVPSLRSSPLIVHDVKAWDVATGQVRGSFPYVGEHLDEGSFELSADGRWLAFVDNSERLPLQVETSHVEFISGSRHRIDISRNTSPGLPRVKIWDVSNWKEVATVDGSVPLAFSRDGTVLATGDRDWRAPVAKLWESSTGRLRSVLKERSPGIWTLAFSPDGRYVFSGEQEPNSLWEVADGRRWAIDTPSSGLSLRGPVFSPNPTLLFPNGLPWVDPHVRQGQSYCAFDVTSMPPTRLALGPGELAISPDGSRYAAVLGQRGKGDPLTVVLRDLPSLRESGRIDVNGLDGAGFSPDGRWLVLLVWATETVGAGPATRHGPQIRLVDPSTAHLVATIRSPDDISGSPAWKFSPDGKSLAVSYRTGSNVVRPGEPDPSERPMTLEIWDLPRR